MNYEKISFNISLEMSKEIRKIMSEMPGSKKTEVLNLLLWKGLKYDDDIRKYKNQQEYSILKILHILREIARTRGDDFLIEVDKDFKDKISTMKSLIENGIDYV